MTKFYLRFSIILFSILVISGCSNDDDDVSPKNRSEFLVNGSWKITAYTINPAYDANGDSITETNLFPLIEDCSKDDIDIYMSNKTYLYDEGATKCDPSHPQRDTIGTWSLSENDTKLIINQVLSSTPVVFNIIELNASTLKITDTFEENNILYTETYTYSH